MNKFKTIIVAGFALAASATAASAEGLYVSGQFGFGGGGGEWDNSGTDIIYGMGRLGSLAVGKDFGHARVEGEIAYRHNNLDNWMTLPLAGEISSMAFMANAYYEFGDNGWFFRPYLGAGIGAANVTLTSADIVTDHSATSFAFQLMLGGAIPFTDNIAATVDFRVLGAAPQMEYTDGTPYDLSYATSSLMLGARYTF